MASGVKKKPSGRGSSKDYSVEECCHFLRIALAQPPVGGKEWQLLAEEHSKHSIYQHYNRDGKSLQRKYHQLSRTKAPTGDPDIPEHVQLAYELKEAIASRALLATGTEELELPNCNLNSTTKLAIDSSSLSSGGDEEVEEDGKEGSGAIDLDAGDAGSKKEGPKKKKRKTMSPTQLPPTFINAPSVNSRGKVAQTGQDLMSLAVLQMQEDRRRRNDDINEERRRREEDNRIRREEREEERRRDERRLDEERRNRDQFMQMFLMAFGAHMHGTRTTEDNSNRNEHNTS